MTYDVKQHITHKLFKAALKQIYHVQNRVCKWYWSEHTECSTSCSLTCWVQHIIWLWNKSTKLCEWHIYIGVEPWWHVNNSGLASFLTQTWHHQFCFMFFSVFLLCSVLFRFPNFKYVFSCQSFFVFVFVFFQITTMYFHVKHWSWDQRSTFFPLAIKGIYTWIFPAFWVEGKILNYQHIQEEYGNMP